MPEPIPGRRTPHEPEWVTARRATLLDGLTLAGARGIEIGPLAMPLVRKSEADVRYVDWADRATLVAKYANDPNVDTDRIVDVDVIWGDRTLAECFGNERDFDFVVASHVLEHVPDLIGWLREIAEMLRPGGRVHLAVPDRRFTFDFFRRTSSLAEFIGAHLSGNRKPSFAQIFDQGAYWSRVDLAKAWECAPSAAEHLSIAGLRQALETAMAVARQPQYLDVHCWVFTPRSLLETFVALIDLDLLQFRCGEFRETRRNDLEMQFVLEKVDTADRTVKAEARQSFLDRLQRLDAEVETDEPWLAEALVREHKPEPKIPPTSPDKPAPRWKSPLRHSRRRRLWRLLAPALSARRSVAARAIRMVPATLPPIEALGRSFAYRRTYDFRGDYIDADHRAIAALPSDGLIRIDPPGYLRPADALALYEHAYFAAGDILELGSAWGLSTLFICQALANSGGNRRVFSIEGDAGLHRTTTQTLREYGLERCYCGINGEPIQALDALVAKTRTFGMAFVDLGAEYAVALESCKRLSRLLRPGGTALIHDFNDALNGPAPGEVKVYAAVVEALAADADLVFLDTVGCCGVLRRL